MPHIIKYSDEPYFDDLPPEDVDYEYIEYLVLKEASGQKVSWKGISLNDINRVVCKLQDKGCLRGSSIDGEPVWAQIKPKGMDRLDVLERRYTE